MTEKDIEYLRDLAREELKKGVTREEALRSFMDAGILDKDGNFTEPYQNLGRYLKRLSQTKKNEASSSEITPDRPSSAKP
jgi:hypothetical protein